MVDNEVTEDCEVTEDTHDNTENIWTRATGDPILIVLFKYHDKREKGESGELFLPGDHVVPLYKTQDWMYVRRLHGTEEGLVPSIFMTPAKEKDKITQNVENILRDTFCQLKTCFRHQPMGRNDKDVTKEDFRYVWGQICNLHLARKQLKGKLSLPDLQMLDQQIIQAVKCMPLFGPDKCLLNENLGKVCAEGLKFYQMYKLYEKDEEYKGAAREIEEKNVFCLTFRGSEILLEFGQGRIDCQVALFHPTDGYLSEFFVYGEMSNFEKVREFGKKKIYFPEKNTDSAYLLVLIVLNEPVSQAKKCVAFGYKKIDALVREEKEVELYIYPTRDQPFSLREQIRRHIETAEKKVHSRILFMCKLVNMSQIRQDDYVFQQYLPLDSSTSEINILYVTINKAKITENFLFGDTAELGIEAYVAVEDGTYSNILDISGNKTGSYQTLCCPGNVADWRQVFILKLNEFWKSQHILFKFYKYDEKKGKRLIGFSFLPLLSKAHGTIVNDKTYKLWVYHTTNDYEPHPANYIHEQIPSFFDVDMKKDAFKKINKKNKFCMKKDDNLEVWTYLKSTVLTEDPNIFYLLDADPKGEILELQKILTNFVTFKIQDAAKKLLFLIPILEALWKIMDANPTEAERVFYCFFEAIHPITITTAYNGMKEKLMKYLEIEFRNKNFFSHFLDAFIKLLTGQSIQLATGDAFIPIFKSLGIFLSFLVKSYSINMEGNSSLDANYHVFEKFIGGIEHFLENEKSESKKGFLFKEIFKSSTLDTFNQLLHPNRMTTFLTKLIGLPTVAVYLRVDASTQILESKISSKLDCWQNLCKETNFML